jgi:hypothetical protein
MNTKLTLSLDRDIIAQAKEFAQSQHHSLSKLVEGYLSQITRGKESAVNITPLVAKLSGVLDASKISDTKREYTDYLADKYR